MQNDKYHHKRIKRSQLELFRNFEHRYLHTSSNKCRHQKVQHNLMNNHTAQTMIHWNLNLT